MGVKGRIAFSDIIPGLPLSACIDYMHCVLIGVYQSLLKLHIGLMTERKLLGIFNKQVKKISFPCELVNHGRFFRPLTELKYFKANEFFNYLFYVGVILLRSRLPDKVYNHYLQLVYGVRFLFETSVEDEIQLAEACLDSFCREAVDIFGTERCGTINLHCLRHLSHQVRQIGLLFVSSAMCSESANRLLVQLFTGILSQCEVICRRYLEN